MSSRYHLIHSPNPHRAGAGVYSSLLPPFFSSPPVGSSHPPWPPWPLTPACPPSFSYPSPLLPPASLQYTSPSRFLCSLFSHSNFRLGSSYSFTNSLAPRHLTARWQKPKMTSRRRCEGEGPAASSGRCGASVFRRRPGRFNTELPCRLQWAAVGRRAARGGEPR